MKRLVAALVCGWAFLPAAAAEQAATSGDDKVVCKREKELGSNMPGKKICMTKAEWRSVTEQSERLRRKLDDRSRVPTPLPEGRGSATGLTLP